MVDAGVVEVRISNKDVCVLSESSRLYTNDLKELIAVLKATQKSTNDCLTRLTNESLESGDKSTNLSTDDEDDDSEDDLSVINDPDLSPKRAKLEN